MKLPTTNVYRSIMQFTFLILILASVAWAGQISEDVGIDIVNGTDAFPGQFPYMAAIRYSATEELRCGAALIDPEWVITAAWCVWWDLSPSSYDVILGLHDFDNFDNGGNPQVHTLQQIFVHPDYDLMRNNIALLRLTDPADLDNPFIQTVTLPPDDEDFADAECDIFGWGQRDNSVNSTVGGVLQWAPATVMADEDCETRLETELCVDSGDSPPCYLDQGGPVVCGQNETYAAGVLSYIDSDCYKTFPPTYTRISLYNDWVNSIIG